MRFGKLSFTTSAILFMGIAAVLAGSTLKLAHMALGGFNLWDTAHALQTIGLVIVPLVVLLNVRTFAGNDGTEPIRRLIPPRKTDLERFGVRPDEVARNEPKPLGYALVLNDDGTEKALPIHTIRTEMTDDEMKGFIAGELPPRENKGPTPAEHCNAG